MNEVGLDKLKLLSESICWDLPKEREEVQLVQLVDFTIVQSMV